MCLGDFKTLWFNFYVSPGMFYFLIDFFIDLFFSLVPCCLASTCLNFIKFLSCNWFLVSYCCAQKRCMIWFHVFFNLTRFVLWLNMKSILQNVPCALKRNVYSVFWDVIFCTSVLSSSWLMCLSFPYWFSVLIIHLLVQVRC